MASLFGIDVSSYQSGISMSQVASEGFAFVVAKVGQGAGKGDRGITYGMSLNPAWNAQRDGARNAGLLLAGYWYVGNTEPPASQAARCRSALGDPTLALALDWEDASGDWNNFLAVLAAFRTVGLNVQLAYTPKWYGDNHGMGPNALIGTGLALWSSRYPSTKTGYASVLYGDVPVSYWAGYAGAPVSILQFSDRAKVAGMSVDANAFQGTRDELATLLAGAPPGPSPMPTPLREGDTGARVVALQRFLNDVFPAYSKIDLAPQRYGPQTTAVVREFQRRVGITGPAVDGTVVDADTLTALIRFGYQP